MRWRRLGTVALAATIFGASWSMGMALADPPEPRLVLRDVGSTSATPIEIDGMYPGLAVTRPYTVALTTTAPDADLALEIEDLVDLERGCNHPETTSGDTSCGEFDGEMSEQLLLSAVLTGGADCSDTGGAASVLASTALVDVASAGVLDLGEMVESGAERCLLLTFDLPWQADNLVQTDAATFDLALHAEQVIDDDPPGEEPQQRPEDPPATEPEGEFPTEGSPTEGAPTEELPTDAGTTGASEEPETRVLGVSTEHPTGAAAPAPVPASRGGLLSVTGVQAGLLVGLGLGSLGGGGLFLWISRRRERARRPA